MSGWRLKIHRKRVPKGLDLLEDALDAFDEKMKEAVEASHEGLRKNETTWPVTKYHWLRNRHIYEAYYKKKMISRDLYDFLVRNKVADGALIAKWKKPGYEYLCSMLAIDKSASNFGTTSICRYHSKIKKNARKIRSPASPKSQCEVYFIFNQSTTI
ncbi:hypothetical protein AAMO2058_000129200 [Amorphochlora amoebiformis]